MENALRRVHDFGSCFSEEVSKIKKLCRVHEDKTGTAVPRSEEEGGITVAKATKMTGP